MTGSAFLVDIGSTFTKGVVVSLGSGDVICRRQERTDPERGAVPGFEKVRSELLSRSGEKNFRVCLASSSARGGLKVAALGLMPDLTVKAAKAACLNAGARLLSCYAHRITAREAAEIEESSPDVILLAGGTDGGDSGCVLHNARALAGIGGGAVVLFAGNKEATGEVCSILEGRDVFTAENVLPELDSLNIEPAREKLREIFLSRIVDAKGLGGVANQLDGDIAPTPMAVMNAVGLLSGGVRGRAGWGEFMAVDAGGATTDVYSAASGAPFSGTAVLRGLPEPFLKRTVEGDIGLRLSLESLVSLRGGRPGRDGAAERWAGKAMSDYSCLPETEEELAFDAELAGEAAVTALRRHCGSLYERYTPGGRVFVQEGKDLRAIKRIVASGGVFAYNPRAAVELERALRTAGDEALLPSSAGVIPDRSYILYAAGLLSELDGEAAFLTMEKNLTKNGTAE